MKKRQLQAEETRRKILESAKILLTNQGINNTNIKDIVNKAGVATGSFYTYFKNKEDVMEAIALDFLNNLTSKVILNGDNLYDQLTDYLKEIVEEIYNSGVSNCRIWFKMSLEPNSSDIAKNKLYSDLTGIKFIFLTAQKNHELKEDVNILEYSELVLATFYGIIALWCVAEELNPMYLMNNYCNTELKDLIESITI